MELTADRITKQYKNKIAVDRVSCTLTEGVTGLLGANGAGKTTLMRFLCGILIPKSGAVTCDGMDVDTEEYRDVLGYLPQEFGYYPEFSGRDFLLYMSAVKGLPKKEARRRTEELIELVGMKEAARKNAKELDGRSVDELLFEELKPALKDVNGLAILQLKEGYEKYAPVLQMIRLVSGDEFDFSHFQSIGFYELRRQRILQRMEKQGFSAAEMAYWDAMEADVRKPFLYHYRSRPANLLRSFQALGFFILLLSAVGLSGVYARETTERMNQLLLCSRHGKKKLYLIKFAAGITWILAAALLVFLALLIPYSLIYGMEAFAGPGSLDQSIDMVQLTDFAQRIDFASPEVVCIGIIILEHYNNISRTFRLIEMFSPTLFENISPNTVPGYQLQSDDRESYICRRMGIRNSSTAPTSEHTFYTS